MKKKSSLKKIVLAFVICLVALLLIIFCVKKVSSESETRDNSGAAAETETDSAKEDTESTDSTDSDAGSSDTETPSPGVVTDIEEGEQADSNGSSGTEDPALSDPEIGEGDNEVEFEW